MTEQTRMNAAERRAITYNYRTPAELADQVYAMLETSPRTRTHLALELNTNSRRIREAIGMLQDKGLIETYKARSARGQMDEYWCLAGQRPERLQSFRSAEILEAFRRAAFGMPRLS